MFTKKNKIIILVEVPAITFIFTLICKFFVVKFVVTLLFSQKKKYIKGEFKPNHNSK